MGASPKCTSSDPFKCHSFQLQQVKFGTNTCSLPSNSHGEIELIITGRRPAGSTEEDCKLMLIAGKGDSPLLEIEFSLDTATPDFKKGFIEVPDIIDPSIPNTVSRKFLVKYVGTTKTRITVHCKFWHGDSVDVCETCAHYALIYLDLG